MPFEARVYIQGVGVYVPHANGRELVVLFPSSAKANAAKHRDANGDEFREHRAVVQYRHYFRDRKASLEQWVTHRIDNCWISFAAKNAKSFELSQNFQRLPNLDTILKSTLPAGGNLGQVLPKRKGIESKLAAGVYMDAGILSPAEEFESKFDFAEAFEWGQARVNRGDSARGLELSNVMKIELGKVDLFSLCRQPWDEEEKPDSILFDNQFDELEVWIRHFDNTEPPDPNAPCPEMKGEGSRKKKSIFPDLDFALNYWVLEEFSKLSRFPVPEAVKSWSKGGPVGGCARQCLPCKFRTVDFGADVFPMKDAQDNEVADWERED